MGIKTPILIFCRIKPQKLENVAENQEYTIKKASDTDVLTIVGHQTNCTINHRPDSYKFQFVKVFDKDCSQELVYNIVAKPIVESALKGYNGTIFAYGQTGSGKTYTISGDEKSKGIIPRSLFDIFNNISNAKDIKFEVHISYLEIYNEQSNDLLSSNNETRKKIALREGFDKVLEWHNLRLSPVYTLSEAIALLEYGDSNRIVCDTPMNIFSSRSHTILTIYLTAHVQETLEIRRAKLNLVDLAGSERVHKTGEEGIVLEEARHINLSLHYLQQVIVALSEPSRIHVPYRNCSLTAALRDSLGGNSMTAMIANIAVDKANTEETISTCRFAQRVALVRNELLVNIEHDLNEENLLLKEEIAILRNHCAELQSKVRLLEQKFSCGDGFESCSQAIEDVIQSPKPLIEEKTICEKKTKVDKSQLKTDITYLIDWLQDELKNKNIDQLYGKNDLENNKDQTFRKFVASLSVAEVWQKSEEEEQLIAKALLLKKTAVMAIHEEILNWWRAHEKTLVQEMLSGQTLNILNFKPDIVPTIMSDSTSQQENTFDKLLDTHSDLLKDFQLLKYRLRHTERCLERIKRKHLLEFNRWRRQENVSCETLVESQNFDSLFEHKDNIHGFEYNYKHKYQTVHGDRKEQSENNYMSIRNDNYEGSESNYSIRESDLNTTFGGVDDTIFSTSTLILDNSTSSNKSARPRLCCSLPSFHRSALGQQPRSLHTLNERCKSPLRRTASVLLTGDSEIDQEIVAFYQRKQAEQTG